MHMLVLFFFSLVAHSFLSFLFQSNNYFSYHRIIRLIPRIHPSDNFFFEEFSESFDPFTGSMLETSTNTSTSQTCQTQSQTITTQVSLDFDSILQELKSVGEAHQPEQQSTTTTSSSSDDLFAFFRQIQHQHHLYLVLIL